MTRESRELRKQFAGRPTQQELTTIEALARAQLALKTQEDNTLTQASNFALGFLKEIDSGKVPAEAYDKAAVASADFLVLYFRVMGQKAEALTDASLSKSDDTES